MTESRLIELLESNSAISTAKYEGLGYAQIQKPRLYASCCMCGIVGYIGWQEASPLLLKGLKRLEPTLSWMPAGRLTPVYGLTMAS